MRKTASALALAGGLVASQAFAEVVTYSCSFDTLASPEGVKTTEFAMKFTYDSLTEKAFITGNEGVSEVSLHKGGSAVTFLEPLDTGVVQVTTVVQDSGKAVHSRHSVLSGTRLVPSQYYGSCGLGG
jgi:hypothetical protein